MEWEEGHRMSSWLKCAALMAFRPDSLAGLGEPDPKINGQSLLVSTMQEDESRDFTCQVDSWQAVPMLTWYLNGKKQETNGSTVLTTLAEAFEQSSSTFTVTAQRADRELNCSLIDPASGKTSNASVLLNVQFKPEIVTMNAKYQEAKDPGLFMVLFVLVRANPPASITWIDQDRHVMVNTSDFLILDTKSYPWLTNHTVQVQLSSVAKNFSFTAANNVGITNSSILPPGLLDTRVELPLLAITVGGALVLGTLLCLNTLIICVVCRKGKAVSGERDVSLHCRCPGHQGYSLGLGVLPPPPTWVTCPCRAQLCGKARMPTLALTLSLLCQGSLDLRHCHRGNPPLPLAVGSLF
uniref:Transmembrane protein 25 n=1 Tax=Gopherus evgoodei TaxID=1825980 RepID=A0A8C4YTZ2_9SAUR